MTGDEHEAQEVVADAVVERGVEIRRRQLALRLDLATELLVLALDELASAQQVDRTVLRGGHEPGARLVRDARLRPALERGDERLLREVLGDPDVAHDPRQTGDEPGRLDPPDRVDRAPRIGSRHGFRSEHLPPPVQDRGRRRRPQPLPSQQRPISRTSTVAHSVAGHWLAIATASAFVRQSRRKKPPTISLDSANGPSTTTRLPFRTAIRTPSASDLRESLAWSTPRALRSSVKPSMRS